MPVVIDLIDSDDEQTTILPPQQPQLGSNPQEQDADQDAEDDEDQPSLKEEFAEIMDMIQSGASDDIDFSYGGALTTSPLGSINIEDLGELPLPLQEADLLRLKEIAEKAPFGKGFETVHDEDVRDAWQIDAKKVHAPASHADFFSKTVHGLAKQALHDHLQIDAEGMGVKAHLYKMLIYEKGGHFLVHRDTEKEPGMFGTYLLHLPVSCGYEGGVLEIKDGDAKKEYDFSGESSKTAFHEVVFYADCEHELKEVTGGWRVVLAFNLIWEKSRPDQMMIDANGIRDMVHYISALKAFCRKWENAGIGAQSMIGFQLGHQYTSTNFSFTALKGEDSVIAEALSACSEDYEIFLTLITKRVIGLPSGGYGDYYGRRRGYWDRYEDDYGRYGGGSTHHTMEEVYDTEYEDEWIHYNDGIDEEHPGLPLEFETDVINAEDEGDLFDSDSDPDDEEYEGYTGNEGPSLQYLYHRALLVIFPSKFAEDMEIQSNLPAFVKRITEMVHVRSGGKKVVFIPNEQEARRVMTKLESHVARLSRGTSNERGWYHLMAGAAALNNMNIYNAVADLIINQGVAPSSGHSMTFSGSSSSASANDSINKEWDCILYLIKSEYVGWDKTKEFISRLWTKANQHERRIFFRFFDLLNQYEFPQEIKQYILEELFAKDIFAEKNLNVWNPSSNISSSPSYYGSLYANYSSLDSYWVDTVLFLLEHRVEVVKINERFNGLIEGLHEYNLLQKLIDKLANMGSNELVGRFPPEILTMLYDLVDRRFAYVSSQTNKPITWVVPTTLISSSAPPDVRQFLGSEQIVFAKERNFSGIKEARRYGESYFNHKQGVQCEYSGSGKKATLRATKTSRPYAKEEQDRVTKFLKSLKGAKMVLQLALATTTTGPNQGSSSSAAAAMDENAEPAAKRFKPYSEVRLI
jgi:hypothetical protein